jgi:hypothetical protein
MDGHSFVFASLDSQTISFVVIHFRRELRGKICGRGGSN